MNNLIKFVLPTVFIVSIGLIIFAFLESFGMRSISDDPAQWGQFGDYIGGLLNPVIGICNLILLTWITIHVAHIDKRPHLDIRLLINRGPDGLINKIDILMKNCGSGSAVLKSIKIDGKNHIHNNFKTIADSFPKGGITTFYSLDDEGALYAGEEETLFSITKNSDLEFITKTIEILKNYTIIINYSNIYGGEQYQIKRNLKTSFNSLNF